MSCNEKAGLRTMAVQKIGIKDANKANEEHDIPTLLCSRPSPALEHSSLPSLYTRSLALRGGE